MKRLIISLTAVLVLLSAFLAGYLYLDQRPHDITGIVRDADGGKPVAGARIEVGARGVTADAAGKFAVPGVSKSSLLTVTASGYTSSTDVPIHGLLLEFSWPVDVALQPTVLEGSVSEAGGGPVVNATVNVDAQTTRTGEGGHFSFKRVPAGATVFASADGYSPANVTFREGTNANIILEPNTLAGTALEAVSNAPVAGAMVQVGAKAAASDAAGKYALRGIPKNATVTVLADGYLTATYTFVETETKRVFLTPNTLTGQVKDAETGSPVAGVTLYQSGHGIQVDAQGRYSATKVLKAAVITVTAEGFEPLQTPVQGRSTLDLALKPNQITGQVTDIKTGKPIITATVYLDSRSVKVDDQGRYTLKRVKRGATVMASADNYMPLGAQIGDDAVINLALKPGVLSGMVRNGVTGAPIAGATVSVDGGYVTTDASGVYKLGDMTPGSTITAKYPGYRLARVTTATPGFPNISLTPFVAKGLYFPFGTVLANGGAIARGLIDSGRQYGLNTIVIDVKGDIRDDVGRLLYKSAAATAVRVGANRSSATELLALLAYAKERNFYTVARIMAFKDDLVARGAPEMAIKRRSNGGLWMDSGGSYWIDPYHPTVWAYDLFIARECAAMGFDEVQFDYVRLPSDGNIGDIYYPSKAAGDTRSRPEVIEALLAQIPANLPNVYVSLDTFGWTTFHFDDEDGIGQRLQEMAKYVDYMSPMVYPSTWQPGSLGYDNPSANPYGIVYKSVTNAIKKIAPLRAKIRPWLQDYWYDAPQVSAQIQAANDAGSSGWLIWNAGGSYTQEAWR